MFYKSKKVFYNKVSVAKIQSQTPDSFSFDVPHIAPVMDSASYIELILISSEERRQRLGHK